jgi:hypothetical protein
MPLIKRKPNPIPEIYGPHYQNLKIKKIVEKYKKLQLNKQNFVVTYNAEPLFGTAQITPSRQYLEDNREDTLNYNYPNSERHAVMLIDFNTQNCYFVQTNYFSLKGETEPEELLKEKLTYVLLNCIHLFHIKKSTQYCIVSLDHPKSSVYIESKYHTDMLSLYFLTAKDLADTISLLDVKSDYVFLEPIIDSGSCSSTVVKYNDNEFRFPIIRTPEKTTITMLDNQKTTHSAPFCLSNLDIVDRAIGNDFCTSQCSVSRRLYRTQILFVEESNFNDILTSYSTDFRMINFSQWTLPLPQFNIEEIDIITYLASPDRKNREYGGGKNKIMFSNKKTRRPRTRITKRKVRL